MLLNNPFRRMLEGRGLLVINLDSTGVMRPFIVGLKNDMLIGKSPGGWVKDVWNRSIVANIAPVTKSKSDAIITKEGGLKLELSADDVGKNRFALFHFPVLIWNQQLNSFLTKDMLSTTEKSAYAEHSILFLNKGIQELSSLTRDLARTVIDSLKPKMNMSTILMWVLIIGGVVLAALFLPKLIPMLQGVAGTAGQAVDTTSKAIIQPIGGG
jgi:hypothetical protein